MKKKILSLTLLLCLCLQYAAMATSPCTTGFSGGYATARAEYDRDLEYCNGQFLAGPCLEEAQRKFNNKVNGLLVEFSDCCCKNNLPTCCN